MGEEHVKGYAEGYKKGWDDSVAHIIGIIKRFKIDVDDCFWCSRKIDYDSHECCGQDGSDISFTKKSYEKIWAILEEKINGTTNINKASLEAKE